MQRIFTRAVGANFKPGDVCDYPSGTWAQIARSADLPLDRFSRPVEDAARDGAARAGRGRDAG